MQQVPLTVHVISLHQPVRHFLTGRFFFDVETETHEDTSYVLSYTCSAPRPPDWKRREHLNMKTNVTDTKNKVKHSTYYERAKNTGEVGIRSASIEGASLCRFLRLRLLFWYRPLQHCESEQGIRDACTRHDAIGVGDVSSIVEWQQPRSSTKMKRF